MDIAIRHTGAVWCEGCWVLAGLPPEYCSDIVVAQVVLARGQQQLTNIHPTEPTPHAHEVVHEFAHKRGRMALFDKCEHRVRELGTSERILQMLHSDKNSQHTTSY